MDTASTTDTGTLRFCMADEHRMYAAIVGAPVKVFRKPEASGATGQTYQEPARGELVCEGVTGSDGCFTCDLAPGSYAVEGRAFGRTVDRDDVMIEPNCTTRIPGPLPVGFSLDTYVPQDDCTTIPCRELREGKGMYLRVARNKSLPKDLEIRVTVTRGTLSAQYREFDQDNESVREYIFGSTGASGLIRFTATLRENPEITVCRDVTVLPNVQSIAGDVTVTMRRAATEITEDLPLWVVIRKSTEAISFNNYFRFMNHVLCGEALSPDLTDYERTKIVNLSH
jgi:hypothetical protein